MFASMMADFGIKTMPAQHDETDETLTVTHAYVMAIRRQNQRQLADLLVTYPYLVAMRLPLDVTGLHLACSLNARHAIALLLAHGADLLAADTDGETALHYAAKFGKPDAANMLLHAGCHPDLRSRGGLTPLHQSARHGQHALIGILLAAGADVEARTTLDMTTPLHQAIIGHQAAVYHRRSPHAYCRRQVQAMILLLQRQANANARDWHGATPLHYAVAENCHTLLTVLLRFGADTLLTDDEQRTPIMLAHQYANSELVRVLSAHRISREKQTHR